MNACGVVEINVCVGGHRILLRMAEVRDLWRATARGHGKGSLKPCCDVVADEQRSCAPTVAAHRAEGESDVLYRPT